MVSCPPISSIERGVPLRCEIGGRGAQVAAHLAELHRDHPGVGQRPEPDRDIDRLGDEVGGAAFEIERDLDVGIEQQELRQLLGQHVDAEAHAGADLQESARLAREAADIGQRLAEVGDDVGAAVEQRLAGQGQRHVAGRALEQAGAEVGLEPGDRAADVGFRQAERAGRRREALQRRDFLEHPQGVEIKHAVLSHFRGIVCPTSATNPVGDRFGVPACTAGRQA